MVSGLVQRLRAQRVLLIVCVVIFVNQLGFGIIVPITPIYAQRFGVAETAIGLVVAIYGLGRFIFSVPVGQAADRYGRRQVILAGTVLTCLGNALCGIAGSYFELLAFRFIAGIGSTAVITGTQIVVADIATRENRGRLMSTYSGFFQFAVGLGPSVGGALALVSGLTVPYFIFATLTLIAGAIGYTQLPDTRTAAEPAPVESADRPARSVTRQLLTNVGFLTVSAIALVAAFNRTGAIFSVIPLVGVERLGLNEAAIGFAITLGNFCNLAIVGFAGMLADRFGRKAVIVPGCIMSCLAFAGFAFANVYPLFVLSAILWGVGVAGSGSASTAYAADQAPPGANGVTMGIYRMLSDVGYVIGPTLLGAIAELANAQTALLAAAAIAGAVAIPFALLAPETGGRRVRAAPRPGT